MPDLEIRRLDPADDAAMDAFQQVYADAELAEDPEAGLYSRADGIAILSATTGQLAEGYGAYVDGRMVGELLVSVSTTSNLHAGRVWIWVSPDHQRQGVGTRLAAYAETRLRALGRGVAHATARIGAGRDNGNLRFASGLGYALANTEIERRLALPLDRDHVSRLGAEAAPHHATYSLRTVVGPVPDDLAASYISLYNLLPVEAPQGDLEVEAGRETTVELAAQDLDLATSGRTRVASYALLDGRVVAYSVAVTTNAEHHHVDQWGTLVDPAHRGHRLGMATKCAMLLALADAFPDKRFVSTTNAETNAPMVAINERLGFTVVQVYGDLQKHLPDR